MTISMARGLKPLAGCLENKMAVLAGNWAIGATGAVGAKVGGKGLTLARTGVGTYTAQITSVGSVAARVPAILSAHFECVTSDADPSNDTDAISTRVLSFVASTGLITFQTFDEAGVVRDPVSGAFIMATVFVKLSSATR